ncbi:MAG TPA: AraC family transcriptional regulator [Chitinophaga sp.]|uniref:helix-turn-helix domain-containing protein n=1 Tax=Chitinophaga sp. TaxID=1869181 RepID=UPI002C3DBDEE|nr:AraC family transcriptional regulator [Chitinophaga sp.]HVI47192.1 AraC family transcriptional regulator [Chitinophaga sp.]
MELNVPYINPASFTRALISNYGFTSKDDWNARHLVVPGQMGVGSLQLYARNDIHFFRGRWKFRERTTFYSCDPVGKKDMIDFRLSADGEVQSAALEGYSRFEFDTTEVDGMRIFIPEKYLTKDKHSLTGCLEKYKEDKDICSLWNPLFGINYEDRGNAMLLEGRMLEFIHYWIAFLNKTDIRRHFEGISDYQLDCLHTAKLLLDRSLAEPPSIRKLSRKTGLNECDLKKGFRKVFGLPVRQYVIKARLEEACRLITGTDLPVGEICNRLGYSNRGHFAELYQRYYGVTPQADRQSHTK